MRSASRCTNGFCIWLVVSCAMQCITRHASSLGPHRDVRRVRRFCMDLTTHAARTDLNRNANRDAPNTSIKQSCLTQNQSTCTVTQRVAHPREPPPSPPGDLRQTSLLHKSTLLHTHPLLESGPGAVLMRRRRLSFPSTDGSRPVAQRRRQALRSSRYSTGTVSAPMLLG